MSDYLSITPSNVNDGINTEYKPSSVLDAVTFGKTEFDSSIYQKGYPCDLYHSHRCPCADTVTGSALPDCRNCGGTGFVYILAKSGAKVLLHSMAYNTKNFNWSETNIATSRATTMDIDKLTYMDKIVLTSVVTDFSQRLKLNETDTEIIAFTTYPIIEVEKILAYDGSNEPLIQLVQGTDYEVNENVIKFAQNYETISIRYMHHPAFIVIDIPRDVMEAPARLNGGSQVNREKMPLHFICRRVNFVLDTDANGSTLIEN